MAARQDKRTKKRTQLLKRRLRYHNINGPFDLSSAAGRRAASSAVRAEVKRKKESRAKARFSDRVAAYNSTEGEKYNGRNSLRFSDYAINSLSPSNIKNISDALKKIKKSPTARSFERLRKILMDKNRKRDKKNGPKRSIRIVSMNIDNRARREVGALSQLQEHYYNNFMVAVLRRGGFSLYRKARDKGWAWVSALYDRGFDINEVYEYDAAGIERVEYSDQQIARWMNGNDKIPRVSSEWGQVIASQYKIR